MNSSNNDSSFIKFYRTIRDNFAAFLPQRLRRLLPYLLVSAGIIFFVPWFPMTLTSTYEYCMHLATSKGWQFGADIVATYGPLGFICLPFYHHSTYFIMLIANIGLYLFMVMSLWWFWKKTISLEHPPCFWMLAILILPCFGPVGEWLPSLAVPYIILHLLVLSHFFSEDQYNELYLILLTTVLAAFVLVKGIFIFLIMMGIAIVAIDQILNGKRIPWIMPFFIIALLALWVLSGQRAENIIPYLYKSVDIAMGYKEGMSMYHRNDELMTITFVLATLSILIPFSWISLKRLRWRGILPISVIAATFFVIFQHGFVVAHPTHIIPAYLAFFSICALILPLMWKLSTDNKAQRRLMALVIAAVFIGLCGLFISGSARGSFLYKRPIGLWTLVSQGTAPIKTAMANHLHQIKHDNPLPKLKGIVDFSEIDFGLADAYELQSIVKPSVTRYQGYTSNLSRQNKKYLENISGPSALLLHTYTSIEGWHWYPTVQDSLSLLGIKSHFKAISTNRKFLLLERREHPLKVQLLKLEEKEVGFNESIIVPRQATDIFVQIDIEPTWPGRIFSLLYKPPACFITVDTGLYTETFRIINHLAREGMLLSPLLNNLPTFQSFYGLASPEPAVKVSSFKIECQKGREWCYNNRIKLTIFRLLTK